MKQNKKIYFKLDLVTIDGFGLLYYIGSKSEKDAIESCKFLFPNRECFGKPIEVTKKEFLMYC